MANEYRNPSGVLTGKSNVCIETDIQTAFLPYFIKKSLNDFKIKNRNGRDDFTQWMQRPLCFHCAHCG